MFIFEDVSSYKNRNCSGQLTMVGGWGDSGLEVHDLGESAAGPLDDMCRRPNAAPHCCAQILAKDILGKESTNKCVSGSVCVDDLACWQLLSGELDHGAVFSADDGVGTLGDDHRPSLAAVLLGQHRDCQSYLLHVCCAQVEGISKCGSLSLVSKDNVSIRHDRHHLVLEELDEEGGREVEAVGPVVGGTVLADLQHRVNGHREEEAGRVDHLGSLHCLPVLSIVEMLHSKVIGGVQLCHQGPVLASDEDSAPSRGELCRDLVLHIHTCLLCLRLQSLPIVVLANTPKVGGGVLLTENPLSNADRVLCCSTSNVVNRVVLGEIVENGLVLSEDSIV